MSPAEHRFPTRSKIAAVPHSPAGMGRIVVRPSHTRLAFLLDLFGTTIWVNDWPPIAGRWDPVPIDVHPGRHHVRVSTRYRGEFGPAEITVDVRPAETLTLYYRSPALSFARGAIGPQPQRTPGMGLIWGLAGCLVLFLALGIALVALT